MIASRNSDAIVTLIAIGVTGGMVASASLISRWDEAPERSERGEQRVFGGGALQRLRGHAGDGLGNKVLSLGRQTSQMFRRADEVLINERIAATH